MWWWIGARLLRTVVGDDVVRRGLGRPVPVGGHGFSNAVLELLAPA